MKDVFVVLIWFLSPVLFYFIYALFAPFFYMAKTKQALDKGYLSPAPLNDESAFSASMFLAMGDD